MNPAGGGADRLGAQAFQDALEGFEVANFKFNFGFVRHELFSQSRALNTSIMLRCAVNKARILPEFGTTPQIAEGSEQTSAFADQKTFTS